MIATGHPERVRRLILAAPYGLDAPGHPLANIPAMSPDQILAALTRDPGVFAGKVPAPLDDAFVAAQARELQSAGRVMPGPYDPALAARLERLTMPTLLLWGDDDKIVPVEHAWVWEPLLPNARSIVFAETGHLLFHEKPETVAAVLAFAEEDP
jgi:pimeloyl-ACP methyl ester carboxylesterase